MNTPTQEKKTTIEPPRIIEKGVGQHHIVENIDEVKKTLFDVSVALARAPNINRQEFQEQLEPLGVTQNNNITDTAGLVPSIQRTFSSHGPPVEEDVIR